MQFLTLATIPKTNLFSLFLRIQNSDPTNTYLMLLWAFLASFALLLVVLFFKKLYFSSRKIFTVVMISVIIFSSAWGVTQIVTKNKYTDPLKDQLISQTENSGKTAGEEDFNPTEIQNGQALIENKITAFEIIEALGLSFNRNGNLAGDLTIKPTEKLELKRNSVGAKELKDESIDDKDIDDDIKLHVQDLYVSRNVEIDGTATFQNGASIANGNMTVSGNITVSDILAEDITADSFNGLTLTANADGFSIAGGTLERTLTVTGSNIVLTGGGNTLVLSGNAQLDQDVSTTSSPTFANLTIPGNLTVDTNTLFVDSTLGRVGIGTITPAFKLDVVGGVNADNLYVDGIVLNGTALATTEEGTLLGQTLYWDGSIWSYSNNLFNNGTSVGIGTVAPGAGYELDVTGDGRFTGSLTVGGGFIMGTTNTDYLVVNGTLNSHLIPASNNVYDLGSPAYYYRNIYTNTLVANNISAGGTNISGTTAETLALNTDNGTVDTQDSYLIFTRGTVTPNGTLRWNSTSDRFEFNQDLWIQDETPATGSTLFTIKAGAGQGTNNLMQWLDSAGGVLGYIDYAGNITTSGSVTGTWNGTVVDLAHGGTNKNLTAANGGIVYSDADSMEILSPTTTANQILLSGASAAPSWSTATYPAVATGTGTLLRANGTNWVASTSTLADTFGINTLLYASGANTVTGLATGINSVLLTDGSGVPSWTTISTDTFTQYILANGTRAFTGSQSLGDFNITNVGDISLDSISSDAGTSINVVLGSDAGDDFTVDTDKLVVEGDTGNVGIGSATPTAKLYVDQVLAADIVDFLDGGNSIFKIADGGGITVGGGISYSTVKPKRSIILTAAGATIPTAGGATQTKVDGANSTYYVLDFNDSTDNASFWQWTMPDSYDSGTIDVTFYWEAGETVGDVIWATQTAGVASNSTEDIDPALGVAQTVTDTAQANANDLGSATISTWNPSWAAGDYITFKVYRDADAGGDTMTGNARLVKVKIEYSANAESD